MMLPVGAPPEATGLFRGAKGFMSSASNIPISLSLRWCVVSGGHKVWWWMTEFPAGGGENSSLRPSTTRETMKLQLAQHGRNSGTETCST